MCVTSENTRERERERRRVRRARRVSEETDPSVEVGKWRGPESKDLSLRPVDQVSTGWVLGHETRGTGPEFPNPGETPPPSRGTVDQ